MSGRAASAGPTVTVQLEAEPGLDVRLTRRELGRYAQALAHCWSLLGINRGDVVAIFDYGASPAAYLASSAFFPHLRRGASDLLGCLPICSDGVPQMAPRVLNVLRYLRPRALFMRPEGFHPLVQLAQREGLAMASHVGFIVVSQDEGTLRTAARDEWQRQFGVPVYSLLRIDRALFLAAECPHCKAFHIRKDLYRVGLVEPASQRPVPQGQEGLLKVAPAFASDMTYVSSIMATLLGGQCEYGPRDARIGL